MAEPRSPERLAYALQALAAELAAEKRRVMLLRRENRELRAKLTALKGKSEEPDDVTTSCAGSSS
jgi:hypothetical protein